MKTEGFRDMVAGCLWCCEREVLKLKDSIPDKIIIVVVDKKKVVGLEKNYSLAGDQPPKNLPDGSRR